MTAIAIAAKSGPQFTCPYEPLNMISAVWIVCFAGCEIMVWEKIRSFHDDMNCSVRTVMIEFVISGNTIFPST